MPRSAVVIIGAGIGGLTLGRCLLRHKIPFVIFDKWDGSPRHNYGITLERRTFEPLLDVLQKSEHDFRRAVAVDRNYSSRTGIASPDAFLDFRANRSALENLLSEPIKGHIKYSHKFRSVQTNLSPENQVEITFDNEVTARSELVIDCSGVHSALRDAVLPEHRVLVYPYVAINGKRNIRQSVFEQIYAPEFGAGNVLHTIVRFEPLKKMGGQTITARLEMAMNNHDYTDPKGQVSISYTYSRPALDDADDLFLPNRPPDAAKNIPHQFFKELNALKGSCNMSSAFSHAFDNSQAGADRLLYWPLRSIHLENSEIKAQADRGILIIGDAAYAEPIVGSVPGGANHVIGQAMRLADKLALSWTREGQLSEMDLSSCLNPKPKSQREDVASHLAKIHGTLSSDVV